MIPDKQQNTNIDEPNDEKSAMLSVPKRSNTNAIIITTVMQNKKKDNYHYALNQIRKFQDRYKYKLIQILTTFHKINLRLRHH